MMASEALPNSPMSLQYCYDVLTITSKLWDSVRPALRLPPNLKISLIVGSSGVNFGTVLGLLQGREQPVVTPRVAPERFRKDDVEAMVYYNILMSFPSTPFYLHSSLCITHIKSIDKHRNSIGNRNSRGNCNDVLGEEISILNNTSIARYVTHNKSMRHITCRYMVSFS